MARTTASVNEAAARLDAVGSRRCGVQFGVNHFFSNRGIVMQSTQEVSHDVSGQLTFKRDKKRMLIFDCLTLTGLNKRISATKPHLSTLLCAFWVPHCRSDTALFRYPLSDTQSVLITVNGKAKRYSPEF